MLKEQHGQVGEGAFFQAKRLSFVGNLPDISFCTRKQSVRSSGSSLCSVFWGLESLAKVWRRSKVGKSWCLREEGVGFQEEFKRRLMLPVTCTMI